MELKFPFLARRANKVVKLLIELFGIEIWYGQRRDSELLQLLIEPFGIETSSSLHRHTHRPVFNRPPLELKCLIIGQVFTAANAINRTLWN